jgi:hypothetical protein
VLQTCACHLQQKQCVDLFVASNKLCSCIFFFLLVTSAAVLGL